MLIPARWVRLTIALTAIGALFGSAGAGAVVGGYVEVHQFVCPPGFAGEDPADFYEACHAQPRAGVVMSATSPDRFYEDATDANGVVVFGDFLTPGQVTLAEAVPSGDFVDYVVACFRVDTGQAVSVEERGDGRAAVAFQLPEDVVAAGTGVVCEWYNVPPDPEVETASLTVHTSACPAEIAPNDRYAQCHENGLVGVEFALQGPVERDGITAGHLGAVRWDGLPAGVYTVAEAVPSGAFVDYAVFCSRTDSPDDVNFEERGDGRAAVQVEVGTGAQVVCDWYNIAPPVAHEQGTIQVTKTWAAGQEPSEAVEVCFSVSSDAAGTDVLGEACTADETYTVSFGPSEPPLQTGVTYYVWERVGEGWSVSGDNPLAVVIPAVTGRLEASFENTRQAPLLDFRIDAFACPADPGDVGLAAGNIPATCAPTAGVAFSVAGTDGAKLAVCTTNADGFCVVRLPDGTAVTVTEDVATLPAGYAPRENPIATEVRTEFAGALFINLPVAPPPTVPAPTATAVPPTLEPVVGRPVDVRAGICADPAPSPRYPLTDLATPETAPAGATEATLAEASFTVIAVSLADLLAAPHAIAAHLSDEEPGTAVACGEIGGPRRADGAIVVGLREQDGSGLVGIAYLAPDPTDPERTHVSVFLAPGLAEEDPTLRPPAGEAAVRSVVDNGPIAPEFQAGYEITIDATGRAEIVIMPPGASAALAEEDRTAEPEVRTVELRGDELRALLVELDALGFFALTQADEVDPDELLVGGSTSRLTVTLVDGTWEVDGNGIPPAETEVLAAAQRLVAEAVGGVEVPDAP